MMRIFALGMGWFLVTALTLAPANEEEAVKYQKPISLKALPIQQDTSVVYDYDIVYVRAPRNDQKRTRWADISNPVHVEPDSDLMLLHPDGQEEVLVAGGSDGAILDPVVSLDGKSVYYVHVKGLKGLNRWTPYPVGGSDIYKLDLKTRTSQRLTTQEYDLNRGGAAWARNVRQAEPNRNHLPYGVFHMGPCPLPGGKLAFVSSRHGYRSPKHDFPTLQLFVLEEQTGNLECIAPMTLGMALHPSVLMDGRIVFSSLEGQGLRNGILWGLWSIHPDGTNWGPIVSAFDPANAPNAFHFQTQLSDGNIIAEEYYNLNNSGFGSYIKFPARVSEGYAAFGPGYMKDPRNPPLRFGRFDNGKGIFVRWPFMPFGVESFTRFASNGEGKSNPSIIDQPDSLGVGKVTHPSGAPDNHLLTVWSAGPVNHQFGEQFPLIDSGLYLIKEGKPIDEPGQMLLIKNDPKYNEQWPRAVVSYKRIYGIDEPKTLPTLANDGSLSVHLPEGTPFGLVGSSSLYKRESYPNGFLPKNSVTAQWSGEADSNGYQGLDPFNTAENSASLNWYNQGADAGKYSNADIHALRIVLMEPTSDRRFGHNIGRRFINQANERLRILGEIPVRKFIDGKQPLDPDGNPDTSFLIKLPADTPFTFQTLDKRGMVLNMSQTWHQVRPGEVRYDCGGCHAHSQQPTRFEDTYAAKADYKLFDLSKHTPLLTSKANDESKQKWDEQEETGLRYQTGPKNVEYHRDIRPILKRSCVPCHTEKSANPPGNLVLDDNRVIEISHVGKVPGTFYRLAYDRDAKYGYKPIIDGGKWRQTNVSRYIREFQSRRSLLIWKIFGQRLDGWTNDDHPTETVPGDANTLQWRGQPIENIRHNRNRADLDYLGSQMPPPEAVQGTYKTPDGKTIRVEPLSEEDRLTFVRWIDLGCPIDLDCDIRMPEYVGHGWLCDDSRPTLTITYPKPGNNGPITRIRIGATDAYTGLIEESLKVISDVPFDGYPAGQNIASLFRKVDQGIWEYKLKTPVTNLTRGRIMVSIEDRKRNLTKIDRVFWVQK